LTGTADPAGDIFSPHAPATPDQTHQVPLSPPAHGIPLADGGEFVPLTDELPDGPDIFNDTPLDDDAGGRLMDSAQDATEFGEHQHVRADSDMVRRKWSMDGKSALDSLVLADGKPPTPPPLL